MSLYECLFEDPMGGILKKMKIGTDAFVENWMAYYAQLRGLSPIQYSFVDDVPAEMIGDLAVCQQFVMQGGEHDDNHG